MNVSGGKLSTFATRECRTASSQPRGRRGRVRSASVTGAPSARDSGTHIDSSMCWTMCTLISVVSYVERPDEVAKKKTPIPATTNASVRPTGQCTPRRRSASTPTTYSPATQTVSTNRNGSIVQSVNTRPQVNLGRAPTVSEAASSGGKYTV